MIILNIYTKLIKFIDIFKFLKLKFNVTSRLKINKLKLNNVFVGYLFLMKMYPKGFSSLKN